MDVMAQQIGLFGSTPRVFVDDETGGIAYYPAVFSAAESAELFEQFERELPWVQETMWMYDHTVTVPRLIARFLPDDERPARLRETQERVERYLGVQFTSCSVQLYRSGNDSVAWHSDHTEELIDLPVIAVLSLGATREMLIRSKSRPRRTFSVDLEPGSLFVMSGRAQEFWEHHIPKAKRMVAPRISVAFRQRKP
jgi:alkylated DNA repair dioxygenase AlkB